MDEYEKRNQESREIAAKIVRSLPDGVSIGVILGSLMMSLCTVIDGTVDSPAHKEQIINDCIENLHEMNKSMKKKYETMDT